MYKLFIIVQMFNLKIMKKILFSAAVAFAAVAGTVCYNSESKNEMSDLAKANVKALAENQKACYLTSDWECQHKVAGSLCVCGWDYGK